MFTGLIETLGTVVEIRPGSGITRFGIHAGKEGFDSPIGASIAINGVCLTVEQCDRGVLFFSAVRETLNRTTLGSLAIGNRVNMERAMKLGDRLDGHMVQGHVDGTGTIVSDTRVGDSVMRTIAAPESLRSFMAEKGSVAVDGISLTIASCGSASITIALIPLTLRETTMGLKKNGDNVNLECDIIARYIHRLMTSGIAGPTSGQDRNEHMLQKMERFGF
jgi:riboflavin synthase